MKYLIPFVLVFTLLSCQNNSSNHSHDHGHSHDHDEHDHEHDHEVELEENEVQLKNNQAKLIGLRMEAIQPRFFHALYKTTGQIQNSINSEFTITASVSGIINFSNEQLTPGKLIQSGQNIGNISSKNLFEGETTEKTINAYNTAKAEFERAQILIQDSLISQSEFNQIKLNFDQKSIEYQAISKNLSQNGIRINSQFTGYIKDFFVKNGDFVEVGQPILQLSQNKRIQLVADVSEKYAQYIPSIQSANFVLAGNQQVFELEQLQGKLLSYGKSLNPNSAFIPIVFEFNNEGSIIPGSFVEVYLKMNSIENALTVLNSSLIEEHGNYYVYVCHKPEIYTKTPVKIGQTDGIRTHILSGIQAGDKVVAIGAYHLKMASMSSEIPHGHTH